jgi:transposase
MPETTKVKLVFIQALYDVECQAQTMSSAQRAALRQTQAQPQLQSMFEWLTQTRHTAAPKSGLARAIDYTLKRWAALKRYAENGERPIDNNPAENAIRPIAIGRKNWLFAGSEQAGQRAAAIQSLLATAKLWRPGASRLAQRHPRQTAHLAQLTHRRAAAIAL